MPSSSDSFLLPSDFSETHVAIICGLLGLGIYLLLRRSLVDRKPKCLVKFLKLHEVANNEHLLKKTSSLLLDEWPYPFVDAGYEEHNFVRLESLNESSDLLPCHLVAIKQIPGQKESESEVIGHVVLREAPKPGFHGTESFAKMLKVGVPVETVKKAARFFGVDISSLVTKFERGESFSTKEIETNKPEKKQEVTMASLLVAPKYRGKGIGKALSSLAVIIAAESNAVRIVGSCSPELVPFYYHLGCHKAKGTLRTDIPRVKLGNELFFDVDSDTVNKARKLLNRMYRLD